ncbi:MAG: EI24 domain-containing protein [Planctomycetota bacterium]
MNRCTTCGSLIRKDKCTRCPGRFARPELLKPARKLFLTEFLIGLRLTLRGFTLTLSTPRLLSLVILPLILNVLVFAGLLYLVITNKEMLRPEFEQEWIFGFDWIRGLILGAAEFVAVLFGIVLALGGTLLASAVLAAPFLEWLSEAVESVVFGQGDRTPVSAHYVWNIWIVPVFQALGVAILQGMFALFFLVLSLTGVLSPLVFIGGVWLTAITLCDIVVARKRFPVRARFALINRSLPMYLGLALPLAFIPFILPFGVAGATLAFLRERKNSLERE